MNLAINHHNTTVLNHATEKWLRRLLKRRSAFERRACDFVIAEKKGLRSVQLQYGANGPRTEHGSYLFQLDKYAQSLKALKSACSRNHACAEMLYVMPTRVNALPAPFFAFDEFQRACDLYQNKSPVPNQQRAWCQSPSAYGNADELGACEVDNCQDW